MFYFILIILTILIIIKKFVNAILKYEIQEKN